MIWSSESTKPEENAGPYSKRSKRKTRVSSNSDFKDEVDEDTIEPENGLTELVREHYLKHLVSLLVKNFESCFETLSPTQVINNKIIEQCATEMEQTALRESVIVRLYQRAMYRLVQDIKKNTEQFQLHSKLMCITSKQKDKVLQTNTEVTNKDKTHAKSIEESAEHPQVDSKRPHGNDSRHRTVQQDLTILDCDNLWPQQYWESQKEETKESTIPSFLNFEPEEQMHKSPIKQLDDECDVDDLLEESDKMLHPITKDIFMTTEEIKSPVLLEDENERLTLDQRVAMIHGEKISSDTDIFPPPTLTKTIRRKVLVWHHERIHQMKRLDSRLKLLSKVQRHRVELRFKELFYRPDIRPNLATNRPVKEPHDESTRQRERVAPWIIKYLMPYYNSGRIANKELFKSTAKYVSDDLLDKKEIPDEIDVQRSVEMLMKNV